MSAPILEVDGKRFVVVPEREYRRLQRKAEDIAAQDKRDVAEATRRKAAGPSRPYSA